MEWYRHDDFRFRQLADKSGLAGKESDGGQPSELSSKFTLEQQAFNWFLIEKQGTGQVKGKTSGQAGGAEMIPASRQGHAAAGTKWGENGCEEFTAAVTE